MKVFTGLKTYKFLSLSVLLATSLVACAETPNAAVAPLNSGQNANQGDHDHGPVTLPAVKFTGRDSLAKPCSVFIAESDNQELLLKVDFRTPDGHVPHAGEAALVYFDSLNGQYFDLKPDGIETALSISSMSLKDPSAPIDRNRLVDYISTGTLDQSLRVEMRASADPTSFMQATRTVLNDPARWSENLSTLNQVQFVEMELAHGDHYHSATCRNFVASGVETTEFEFTDEDEHDHN